MYPEVRLLKRGEVSPKYFFSYTLNYLNIFCFSSAREGNMTDFSKHFAYHTRTHQKEYFTETFANNIWEVFISDGKDSHANPDYNLKKDTKAFCGIRPVIDYSNIKKYVSERKKLNTLNKEYGFLAQFGMYPKSMVTSINEYNLEETSETYSFYDGEGNIFERRVLIDRETQVKYIKHNNKYYMIEPLWWIVDKEKQLAITQDIIYCMPFSLKPIKSFKDSLAYAFLNKCFMPDIMREYVRPKVEIPVLPHKNDLEVDQLINRIKETCTYLPIKEQVIAKISNLIDDYNQKLEELKTKLTINYEIKLGEKEFNKDYYYDNLINSLHNILEKINKFKEMYKDAETIQKCLDIINGTEIENYEDDLFNDIKTIIKVILPYLPEAKRDLFITSLKDIFENQKQLMQKSFEAIFGDSIYLELKNKSENIILLIRSELQELLANLNIEVSRNYIMESMANIVNQIYAETHNTFLALYLNVINTITNEVMLLLQQINSKDLNNQLQSILNFDLTNINDMHKIYKKLFDIIIELETFRLSLEEYQSKIQNIEARKIILVREP